MKSKILIMTALLCFIGFSSCDDGDKPKKPTNPLAETSWKLVGYFDVESNELIKEFEPNDCENCYMIKFESDTIKHNLGNSCDVNSDFCLFYTYKIIDESTFEILGVGYRTGHPYCNVFLNEDVKFFVSVFLNTPHCIDGLFQLKENSLKLYCNDRKNYLLYKEVK